MVVFIGFRSGFGWELFEAGRWLVFLSFDGEAARAADGFWLGVLFGASVKLGSLGVGSFSFFWL